MRVRMQSLASGLMLVTFLSAFSSCFVVGEFVSTDLGSISSSSVLKYGASSSFQVEANVSKTFVPTEWVGVSSCQLDTSDATTLALQGAGLSIDSATCAITANLKWVTPGENFKVKFQVGARARTSTFSILSRPSAHRYLYGLNSSGTRIHISRVLGDGVQLEDVDNFDPGLSSGVALAVHPNRRVVYVAFSGSSDVIRAYGIDPTSGALSAIAGNDSFAVLDPRDILVSPGGNRIYVASSSSGQLWSKGIDPATGLFDGSSAPLSVGYSGEQITKLGQSQSGDLIYVHTDQKIRNLISTTLAVTGTVVPMSSKMLAISPSGRFAATAPISGGSTNQTSLAMWRISGVNHEIQASGGISVLGLASPDTALAMDLLAWDPFESYVVTFSIADRALRAFQFTPSGSLVAANLVARSVTQVPLCGSNPKLRAHPRGDLFFLSCGNELRAYRLDRTTGTLPLESTHLLDAGSVDLTSFELVSTQSRFVLTSSSSAGVNQVLFARPDTGALASARFQVQISSATMPDVVPPVVHADGESYFVARSGASGSEVLLMRAVDEFGTITQIDSRSINGFRVEELRTDPYGRFLYAKGTHHSTGLEEILLIRYNFGSRDFQSNFASFYSRGVGFPIYTFLIHPSASSLIVSHKDAAAVHDVRLMQIDYNSGSYLSLGAVFPSSIPVQNLTLSPIALKLFASADAASNAIHYAFLAKDNMFVTPPTASGTFLGGMTFARIAHDPRGEGLIEIQGTGSSAQLVAYDLNLGVSSTAIWTAHYARDLVIEPSANRAFVVSERADSATNYIVEAYDINRGGGAVLTSVASPGLTGADLPSGPLKLAVSPW